MGGKRGQARCSIELLSLHTTATDKEGASSASLEVSVHNLIQSVGCEHAQKLFSRNTLWHGHNGNWGSGFSSLLKFFLLCWRVIIADFWRAQRAVSAQSSLGDVRGTDRCQSQQGSLGWAAHVPHGTPSIPIFELTALTRPTCSPLADQATRHWGWFGKLSD